MSTALAPYAVDPFGPAADPDAYVPFAASERARDEMQQVLDVGGVPALVGPSGYGKTLLLRLAERDAQRTHAVFVPFGTLEPDEFFALLAGNLALKAEGSPRERVRAFIEKLASRGGVLLLIDDADGMPDATAEELAALRREAGGALRIAIAALEGPDAERVCNRIGADLSVVRVADGIAADEAKQYIDARLAHAGARPDLLEVFDEETIASLHRESQGVPRRMNQAAENVMREAWPGYMPRLRDIWGVERPGMKAPDEATPEPPRATAPPPERVASPPSDDPAPATLEGLMAPPKPAAPPTSPPPAPPLARSAAPPTDEESILLTELPPPSEPPPAEEPRARERARPPAVRLVSRGEPARMRIDADEDVDELPDERPWERAARLRRTANERPRDLQPRLGQVGTIGFMIGVLISLIWMLGNELTEGAFSRGPSEQVLRRFAPGLVATRTPDVAAAPPAAVAPSAAMVAPGKVAVSINAQPWALVEVDGRSLGVTPLAGVELEPGPHDFRARMGDGRIHVRRIVVGPDNRTVVFE